MSELSSKEIEIQWFYWRKNALSRLMKGQGYIDAFHVHVYTCSIYAIQLKLFNVKFESM